MAKIGLNNFWYSHLTEALDGTPSFDGAKTFGKAVSCNVNVTNNDASLYADDALAESDTSFQSGEVSLGVDDDREATFADVLGHDVTEEGEVISNANDVAPWIGLGRIIVKMVNNVKLYKTVILYKTKFSEPSDEDSTKGESTEFSTPTISGKIATLANGDWKDVKVFTSKDEALAYIHTTFNTTYTISYNVNGGTGEIDDVVVNYGDSTTLNTGATITPPTNKVFDGWALSATATTKDYAGGASYTPTADVTFYAVYKNAE